MKRVVWSVSAVDELTSIIAYISRNNPPAAERIAELLEKAVLALAEYPVGRRGRVAGTFEKVLTDAPYIIAYALGDEPGEGETLTVLRIIHRARDRPEGGWPAD
ncbi:MAG: type II toxin-antitoxin system RelE/ParE family toxin [Rhodospirillales bacterium]|nr:type II toxin-antitoxin system RelE/ParE family toxin [Rhodospirillales bacterium]